MSPPSNKPHDEEQHGYSETGSSRGAFVGPSRGLDGMAERATHASAIHRQRTRVAHWSTSRRLSAFRRLWARRTTVTGASAAATPGRAGLGVAAGAG